MSKLNRLGVLSALVAALLIPIAVSAAPTAKTVAKSTTPSKQFMQYKAGMQQTAFKSNGGMNKTQVMSAAHLSSTKDHAQKP